ncbi:hypothetical protein E2562_005663 [Oryza meyeriana var. granulata]|uniref:Uncharacterized protein n=1 Tax=Oryza meyeriana var. granulata TaxID=110450 RepID=A0A6G1F428_9ORYZ|nr:hypothetical protein E2562_005663 [Oryza meyeriana var. granulata]
MCRRSSTRRCRGSRRARTTGAGDHLGTAASSVHTGRRRWGGAIHGRDSRRCGRTSRRSVASGMAGGGRGTAGDGGGWDGRLQRRSTGGGGTDAEDSRRWRLGLQAARTEDWRRR